MPESSIPSVLRFPLLVLLSLTISSMLYSFAAAANFSGDLAAISRALDQWWEVGILVGWRTFALAIGWLGNYDSYDLASLTLLSHGPTSYLLNAFYNIPPSVALSSLLIDIAATYIPFRLLRSLSEAHAAPTLSPADDLAVQTITTLLGAVVFSTTLYTAFVSYLRFYLVTYFTGIPTIAVTYTKTPYALLPMTLLFGLATKSFIFTTASAIPSSSEPAFDPASATLWETLIYNVWGYSPRTKVVIKRTATLALVSGLNTFIQSQTIEGVETTGALVYSGTFAVATGLTGAALGLVGAV